MQYQHFKTKLEEFVKDSIKSIVIPDQIEVKIINEFSEKFVLLDKDQMVQVLTNIEKNAVEAMPKGGALKIKLSDDTNNFVLEISDTRIGMTKEEKGNLFQEFVRAKNKKTKTISGSGLGFSILKKIVDLNKGKILVDSLIDFGSTFTVKIPAV